MSYCITRWDCGSLWPMMNHRLNRKPAKIVPNAKQYHKLAMISPAATLPICVDLRSFCSPVEDQGNEGSCTAHALAGGIEYLQNIELSKKMTGPSASLVFPSGQFERVSRAFIYYNERDMEGDPSQDDGASLSTGVQVTEQSGVCRELLWPYAPNTAFTRPPQTAYDEAAQHKVVSAYQLSDLLGMKHSLASGYPFVFGIQCYDSLMSSEVAQSGEVPVPGSFENYLGGHALLCVGYNDADQRFLFRNSWGSSWGQGGYAWIPYAYMMNSNLAEDLWSLQFQTN